MIVAVADTHAVIWYLYDANRLSSAANQWIDQATQEGNQIGVASISLAEVVYLGEKGSISADTLKDVLAAFDDPESVLTEIPLDRRVVQYMLSIPRPAVPDMPDRIIAATALQLGVPLISRDRKIALSEVETIW